MIAKAIRKQKSGHLTYVNICHPTYIFFDIVEKYLSDSDDSKCMKNVCRNCQPAKISYSWNADLLSLLREIDTRELSDDDISDYISFTMWICQDKEIKKGPNAWSRKNSMRMGNK